MNLERNGNYIPKQFFFFWFLGWRTHQIPDLTPAEDGWIKTKFLSNEKTSISPDVQFFHQRREQSVPTLQELKGRLSTQCDTDPPKAKKIKSPFV